MTKKIRYSPEELRQKQLDRYALREPIEKIKQYETPVGLQDTHFKNTERHCCKVFGCGKKLTLIEDMAGDICTKHMEHNIKLPYA